MIRDSEDARRADLVKLSSTRGTESAKWTRPRQVRRWIKKREDSVNATIKRFFRRKKNTNATEQGIQLVHDELIFFFTDFIDPSTVHRVNEPVFHYGKLMGKNRYRDLPSTCLGLFPGCACLKKKRERKTLFLVQPRIISRREDRRSFLEKASLHCAPVLSDETREKTRVICICIFAQNGVCYAVGTVLQKDEILPKSAARCARTLN